MRARIVFSDGGPIAGGTVAVADHPELGHTLTRADRTFDFVVNGGGPVHVRYAAPGYLPTQRQVETD